jgi:hypothetical protein
MTLNTLEHRKFNWYQGAPDRCTLMAVGLRVHTAKKSAMAIDNKLNKLGAPEQQQNLTTIP